MTGFPCASKDGEFGIVAKLQIAAFERFVSLDGAVSRRIWGDITGRKKRVTSVLGHNGRKRCEITEHDCRLTRLYGKCFDL